jgi:hypothetical protein
VTSSRALYSAEDPDDYLQGEAQSLLGLLTHMQRQGYSGNFGARPGAMIACSTCGVLVPASTIAMDELRRLEGASDPADMLAVVALQCQRCGARGTLVLGYGPESSSEDADVLAQLPEGTPPVDANRTDVETYASRPHGRPDP